MMRFINWFKGALQDEKGVASFRRIDNWMLMCLVIFIVIWPSVKNYWTMYYIYVLIILLVAGFLNTSVITVDNILRFFNRDKEPAPQPPPPPPPGPQHVEGELNITPNPEQS